MPRIAPEPRYAFVAHPEAHRAAFLDPRAGATHADHDRRTDAVCAALMQGGEASSSNTTWRGKRCMLISVCNWQTGGSDVARAVAAVARVLAK